MHSNYKFLKIIFISFLFLTLSGCQIGYLLSVGYDHLAMLNTRVPIEESLKDKEISEEQKRKILLTQDIRTFAFEKIGLKKSNNYTEFVNLKRPYVTYAVMASYKWKLESYLWHFPIIGNAPYKGYYNEKSAEEEAEQMRKQDFDVYVRGVPAFSTLGKLTDPLLSSMLSYTDYDLVNTVIHELVHTTLFIKDNIDFNERLAVFVAGKGTEIFYREKEGASSKTVAQIKSENEDDAQFSEFITKELDALKKWYEKFDHTQIINADEKEKIRQARFEQIKINFKTNLLPKLKTRSYGRFASGLMNNATLGTYHTYMKDLDIFEKVYQKNGSNISAFLKKCEELNHADNPEAELKKWAEKD